MNKMFILKAVASIGKKAARIGCNSASILGYHQPTEPKELSTVLKKNK
ncbi:MAG: cyclic lactone autoinducer peptide [Oscillospiraceae bacterium]|nr:cyclic lactone autoinducer peptide [Oscillospiraceae bacterium]